MATTYDKASLVMIPSGYKDDKLYSIKPTDGSGDFTFSRDGSGASPATRVNASGYIEKGRENILLQSNTFDTTWYDSGVTETSGQAGYDGSNDAWEITRGGAFNYKAQDVTTSGVQTFSTYAKRSSFDFLLIRFQRTASSYAGAYFDLGSGVVGSTDGSGVIDSNIESVGGDWYRISITFNESLLRVLYYPVPSDGGVGTGGSGSVFIQDAQLESGLVATDYIETTTAPVSAGLLGDMPRLDYSGGATCPSLLLEPSRVNSFNHSEYFGTWNLSRASAFGSGSALNDTTSPEGVVNAAYIQQASGQTTAGGVFLSSLFATGTYSLSVFAKAKEQRYLRLGGAFAASGGSLWCNFDLQEGVAGTPDSGVTPSIEPLTDGWYRCSITATKVDTTGQNIFIYQANSLNGSDATPLDGLYIYGAQLESSASYPTSYIPTYGSASTRGDDYQTSTTNYKTQGILGSTWTFLYDQTFVDVAREAASSLFLLDNGIGGDGLTNVRISLNSSGTFRLQDSDGTQLSTSGNKILCRYDGSTIAWFVDGSLLDSHNVTDTDFANLDQYNPSQNNKKKVVFNQLLIFPTSLTDAECIALTA